jgi:hypothetical protein
VATVDLDFAVWTHERVTEQAQGRIRLPNPDTTPQGICAHVRPRGRTWSSRREDQVGPVGMSVGTRFRAACLPLPERVRALADLAGTAVKETDQGLASANCNQAALIASDLGLPDLAREMCHQHAAACLRACP